MYSMQVKTPTCVGAGTYTCVCVMYTETCLQGCYTANISQWSPLGGGSGEGPCPAGEKHEVRHKYCCFFLFLDPEQICVCSIIGTSKRLSNVVTLWSLEAQ